jgi:outer membrane cobalamin receptor
MQSSKAYLFLILILSINFSYGQTTPSKKYTLSGIITDGSDNEPLTGVSVQVLGTEKFDLTGLDGSFRITDIPEGNYEVEFTYLGYTTYVEKLNLVSNRALNVKLRESSLLIDEVIVTSVKDYSTDGSARADERKADNVINIISARAIDLSPDLTVANITQRVSGVSLERNNNGDGQYAIVRGMDKRYNYTLVNGIKIPSPDAKNRYVPLDIFPSDLLDRLVVSKSLLPNMEGDAIGGVIDLKMKDAPAQFTVNANVGLGYNMMNQQRAFRTFDRSQTSILSPNRANGPGYRATVEDFPYNNLNFSDRVDPLNQFYALSIGNRFFNNKLGWIVAGSRQHTFRGANSLFMSTFVDQENNNPYFEIMELREFSTEQQRNGLHTKLDFKPNASNKLNLYLAYLDLQEMEVRSRIDTIIKIGRGQGPGTGRVELRERSRQRLQKIFNSTLQGEHDLSAKFKVDWSLVYSFAKNDDPDMAELKWLTGVVRNGDGELVTEPILYDRDFTRRWANNSDTDLAAYLNMGYKQIIMGTEVDFSFGGLFRNKNRSNSFDTYLFRTSPIRQEWSGDVNDYTFTLFNNIGTPTDPLNYECTENVAAGYAMFRFQVENIQFMGGVRNETTWFSWETSAPPQVRGRVGDIQYNDLLPSLHIKYMPNKKTNLRASYFSSLSRPNFFEVIPYDIFEDDFRERGNPDLNRTRANNIDVRYEYFSTALDQILVGAFYKRIIDPIESALLLQGQTIFLQPNNFGTANNMGLEFDFTKYYRNYGIRAFYTLTLSQITTSKIVRFRDEQGNLTSRNEDQTRPLQGQSMHISNIAFLYKNQKQGLDMQLAMVYTGDRIISVSPYLDNDIWQRGFVQLDFSIDKKLADRITLYGKVNNLLNTPLLADIRLPNTFNPDQVPSLDSSRSVLVREDFYWQTLLLGIKFKL